MGLAIEQYDSAHRPHAAVRELSELFRYRDLIRQLVSRNVKVRYKRSVLGLAWSMLSPLMTMVALSVVFTQVFRPTAPNYPVYLFPGLLLWSFFAQTTSTIAVEVVGGVELWKRIYTPRTAFAVATVCTGLVHLALALGPLFALMLLFHTPFGVALVALPVVVLFTALFALGVGLAVAAVAGYFADVADLYQIVLGTWMYFTPVIYPRTILPERYQWIFRMNPMALFVEAFRMPIYEHTMPRPALLLSLAVLGIATCAFGWWLFTRVADDLARRG
jgi:lipopolysaccharide transport system permease protein